MKSKFEWLFEESDPVPFAILRIGLGSTIFLTLLSFFPYLEFYYSGSGFLPQGALADFGAAPYPVSLLFLSDDIAWVRAVYFCTLILAGLYTIGAYTKWSGPLLWLGLISFVHRNLFVVDGSLTLMVQLIIPMMLADTGGRFSWDRKVRKKKPKVFNWLKFVLCFQLSLVYLMSGVYKLMGADWIQGKALNIALSNPSWRRFDFDWLLGHSLVVETLGLITVLIPWWELFFPLLLLNRHTRLLSLAFGLFLHGSQWFTINTGFFAPLLLSMYPLFLTKSERTSLGELVGRFRSKN